MPASAVYLFSLNDTQFYFSRSKGPKLSLATGIILSCPAYGHLFRLVRQNSGIRTHPPAYNGELALGKEVSRVYTAAFQINSQPCQTLPPAPPPLRVLLKLPPGKFWRACWPFFTSSWQRRRQAENGTPFSFPPAFWRQPSCCSASVFSGDTRFPAPDCQAGWPWVWEAAISLSGHGFPPGFIMRA